MATKFKQNIEVTGTMTATSFSGDGSSLTGIDSGEDITIQDEGSPLATAATTINFVGSGVTATGTGATKTITIAGGGTSYANSDVDTHLNQSTAGTDEVLSWNGSDYAWVSNAGGGGYSNADVDTHLNTSTATSNQVLSWDGADYDWVAQSGGSDLNSLSAGVLNTASDSIAFIDADDSNTSKKETVSDFLTAIAGSGITVSGNQLTASGGGSLGDLSISASTLTSSGATVTIDDDLVVTGSISSSQAGAPILTSASTLTLQATTRTIIDATPLQLHSFTTTERNALTGADGDMIYNSSDNNFQVFANGSWGSLRAGASNEFNVTAPNAPNTYTFNDPDNLWFPTAENDPTLYLRRGETYYFVINAPGHPFEIRDTSGGSAWTEGITNNTTDNGTIVFKIPMSISDTALAYQCTSHAAMEGSIAIV